MSLKSSDKDPSIVKSYRPVKFLPVLGKMLERNVVKRIDSLKEENQ